MNLVSINSGTSIFHMQTWHSIKYIVAVTTVPYTSIAIFRKISRNNAKTDGEFKFEVSDCQIMMIMICDALPITFRPPSSLRLNTQNDKGADDYACVPHPTGLDVVYGTRIHWEHRRCRSCWLRGAWNKPLQANPRMPRF